MKLFPSSKNRKKYIFFLFRRIELSSQRTHTFSKQNSLTFQGKLAKPEILKNSYIFLEKGSIFDFLHQNHQKKFLL